MKDNIYEQKLDSSFDRMYDRYYGKPEQNFRGYSGKLLDSLKSKETYYFRDWISKFLLLLT